MNGDVLTHQGAPGVTFQELGDGAPLTMVALPREDWIKAHKKDGKLMPL